MTDADKKLYDKAEELFCQNCKLRTEQCLFAYRKVNGIEDCHKSCGCEEVPAWIDGYKEGLKAKINDTTISDYPSKDGWRFPSKGELPKEGVNILLYFKEHFCVTRGYSVGYYENEVFYNDCEMEENVIAWRYIEPPKEEE